MQPITIEDVFRTIKVLQALWNNVDEEMQRSIEAIILNLDTYTEMDSEGNYYLNSPI